MNTGPATPSATPVVELRGVSKTYPGTRPVDALRHCDLTVNRGEHLAVVGRSGSGKSTLLNILGLLDEPTRGDYLLDGQPTRDLTERARSGIRAHRIGFIFQAFHLVPYRSALENVEIGLIYQGLDHRRCRARASEALDRVGLADRTRSTPTEMSGGERQRVAIARALVRRPALVLCDEPTGNLDTATGDQVLELIDELVADGLTVIVITHDHAVARRAHRHIEVSDGRLTAVSLQPARPGTAVSGSTPLGRFISCAPKASGDRSPASLNAAQLSEGGR